MAVALTVTVYVPLLVIQAVSLPVGQSARSVSGQGGSVDSTAILGALLKAAHPVHGTWGSGRLLRTMALNCFDRRECRSS